MRTEHLQQASQYQKEAHNLLTDVSRLIEKAQRSIDSAERRELYLTAMGKAQKAYSLIGRAKKLSAKSPSSDKL
jgi:hypothetical protein